MKARKSDQNGKITVKSIAENSEVPNDAIKRLEANGINVDAIRAVYVELAEESTASGTVK